jgi:hypothetical protein
VCPKRRNKPALVEVMSGGCPGLDRRLLFRRDYCYKYLFEDFFSFETRSHYAGLKFLRAGIIDTYHYAWHNFFFSSCGMWVRIQGFTLARQASIT